MKILLLLALMILPLCISLNKKGIVKAVCFLAFAYFLGYAVFVFWGI